MKRKLKLVKPIISLVVGCVLVVLLVRWCRKDGNGSRFSIENTPMRIEQIRAVAHLATISYRDEVVVDSVEYYHSASEQLAGNLEKLTDVDDFKHGISGSAVKRRLTLIVAGEIRYGFDLKSNTFTLHETDSNIRVRLPEPRILDVVSTPSSTRIFQENGDWQDFEILKLKNRARKKMVTQFEALSLRDQACKQLENIIKRLLPADKKITFEFMPA